MDEMPKEIWVELDAYKTNKLINCHDRDVTGEYGLSEGCIRYIRVDLAEKPASVLEGSIFEEALRRLEDERRTYMKDSSPYKTNQMVSMMIRDIGFGYKKLLADNDKLRAAQSPKACEGLVKALEGIIRHQQMIGGSMSHFSSTIAIAEAALNEYRKGGGK